MIDRALLARIPLFASLGAEQLEEISSKLATRNYRRGEVIFHQGDAGSALYIIRQGQVKIAATSSEGVEVILAFLSDTDFFGELSLLDGKSRSASAIVMAPTQMLVLQRENFMEILVRHPELVSHILTVLCDRLRHSDALFADVVFLNLSERLAKRLLELAKAHGRETADGVAIDLQVTQQDLSDSVGASRVAVNKQLGLYQDAGIISIGRHQITIIRPDELTRSL